MKKIKLFLIAAFLSANLNLLGQISTETKISEDTNENSNFGYSISSNNSYIAIGARHKDGIHEKEGGVYLYDSENFTSTFICPEEMQENNQFGNYVLIQNNLLIVSAINHNNGGAVFVYDITSDIPVLLYIIENIETSSGDEFGKKITAYEDRLYISAPGDDSGGANVGAVYVYQLVDGGYTFMQKLTPEIIIPMSQFGYEVLAMEDKLIVGEYNSEGPGRVYVYSYNESDESFDFTIILEGDGTDSGDLFGNSMCYSNNQLFIGAVKNGVAGAVYVYDVDGETITLDQKLLPTTNTSETQFFGSSISVNENHLLIGSKFGLNEYNESCGFVTYYQYDGISWNKSEDIFASTSFEGDFFGSTVDINDSYILVSAYGSDNEYENSGAVYYYKREFLNSANNEYHSIEVYPNPFTNYLKISDGIKYVKIFNSVGEIVYQTSNPSQTINTTNFKSGFYLVEITDNKGIFTKKIIK